MSPEDAMLATRSPSTDERFDALVAEHDRLVRRSIRAVLGRTADEDDLVQEVFLRLVIRMRQPGSLEVPAWLCRVARNVSIDELRRRRPMPVEESELDTGVGEGLDRHVLAAELRETLAAGLAHMPERQRRALLSQSSDGDRGRTGAGFNRAAAFGISPDAFESLVARGRRHLREELERSGLERGALAGLPILSIVRFHKLFAQLTAIFWKSRKIRDGNRAQLRSQSVKSSLHSVGTGHGGGSMFQILTSSLGAKAAAMVAGAALVAGGGYSLSSTVAGNASLASADQSATGYGSGSVAAGAAGQSLSAVVAAEADLSKGQADLAASAGAQARADANAALQAGLASLDAVVQAGVGMTDTLYARVASDASAVQSWLYATIADTEVTASASMKAALAFEAHEAGAVETLAASHVSSSTNGGTTVNVPGASASGSASGSGTNGSGSGSGSATAQAGDSSASGDGSAGWGHGSAGVDESGVMNTRHGSGSESASAGADRHGGSVSGSANAGDNASGTANGSASRGSGHSAKASANASGSAASSGSSGKANASASGSANGSANGAGSGSAGTSGNGSFGAAGTPASSAANGAVSSASSLGVSH